jgi:hypothetical protein
LVVLLGGGTKPTKANAGYGQLPKWLPKTTAPAKPQYEQATPQHPVLAEEQGYTVHATLPSGSVDITAAGPGFPSYVTNDAQRGAWPSGKPVPSLFYVTLSNVRGTIPISRAAFSVENSAFQHVGATASVKGGGTLPASVKTGQTVTFLVRTRTLEGQGAIAWTPVGSRALVAWIYRAELD